MKIDQLQTLVEQYLQTKDNKTIERIIVQLKPFLSTRASYISKLARVEFEDIMQELQIVLLQRLQTYNKERGKFITYLYNSMRGDPTDTLQRLCKKKRGGDGKNKYLSPISLHSQPFNDSTTELHEVLCDPRSSINETILKTDMKDIIKKTVRKIRKVKQSIKRQKISKSEFKEQLREIHLQHKKQVYKYLTRTT